MSEKNATLSENGQEKKLGKRKTGLLAAAVIVLLTVIIGCVLYFNSDGYRISHQMDLGQRYLVECNYEQAIVEFQKVIDIDPMSVDAYLGMAEAYEGMGDPAMALQVLEQGYEQTDDEQLLKEIERLEQLITPAVIKPVEGEVILPYSMDQSVYFATLKQYKYNPGILISAAEGTSVRAASGGIVIRIYENEELGQTLIMDLGDGYEATYGQLQNIQVSVGDRVMAGDIIAEVAAPTKYYSVEGSNLYIMVMKDNIPVNPEEYFGW